MSKLVKLTDKQRAVAQEKFAVVQRTQRDFQVYMEGLMAGLGLDGNWRLNINTWTFEKTKKPKVKGVKDAS